ncbi:ORF177 [Saltwater crocodilepox virus]|nr:ORF177 [Saltwater crocodilepox virus]
MIAAYQPFLLGGCLIASIALNFVLSQDDKIDALFILSVIVFLWYIYHIFLYIV